MIDVIGIGCGAVEGGADRIERAAVDRRGVADFQCPHPAAGDAAQMIDAIGPDEAGVGVGAIAGAAILQHYSRAVWRDQRQHQIVVKAVGDVDGQREMLDFDTRCDGKGLKHRRLIGQRYRDIVVDGDRLFVGRYLRRSEQRPHFRHAHRVIDVDLPISVVCVDVQTATVPVLRTVECPAAILIGNLSRSVERAAEMRRRVGEDILHITPPEDLIGVKHQRRHRSDDRSGGGCPAEIVGEIGISSGIGA